jgi:hypothetical protein
MVVSIYGLFDFDLLRIFERGLSSWGAKGACF